MKIEIKGGGHNLNLIIPNGLVFNRFSLGLANFVGRKYAGKAMEGIPPEAGMALVQELKRVRKKHGSWELVEVTGADGEMVKIVL